MPIGSKFDDFLREEGILETASEAAQNKLSGLLTDTAEQFTSGFNRSPDLRPTKTPSTTADKFDSV